MPTLTIRDVPDELVLDLKVSALSRKISLREVVLERLTDRKTTTRPVTKKLE